jgi:hypothetical protein
MIVSQVKPLVLRYKPRPACSKIGGRWLHCLFNSPPPPPSAYEAFFSSSFIPQAHERGKMKDGKKHEKEGNARQGGI